MQLTTMYEGDAAATVVSATPDRAAIAQAVRSLDWNRFAFVTLTRDEENWIDGSGCLAADTGLSVMLSENGVQFVTETAPATPDDLVEPLAAYLAHEMERLFALLYAVPGQSLTAEEIAALRAGEIRVQGKRRLAKRLPGARQLFQNGQYAEFLAQLSPFEMLLEPADQRRFALARTRLGG